jgi:hypothetical protein
MFLSVTVSLLLSVGEPYVRTQTDSGEKPVPTGPNLYWNQNTITFQQNTRGNADTVGDTEFQAVTDSFAAWQEQMTACGALSLVEGPRVTHRKVAFSDDFKGNQNVVLFREVDCTATVPAGDSCWTEGNCYNVHDCWAYRRETIALTTTTFNSKTGQILDADIELNAAAFNFTTVNTPPCPQTGPFSQACVATDIQNTMTHEIGHLLGLDHTTAAGSTMNASAPTGETSKRTLDSGTAQFICDVYPQGMTFEVQKLEPGVGNAVGCTVAPGWAGLALLGWLGWPRRRRNHGVNP